MYRIAPFTHPANVEGFGSLKEKCKRATIFCDIYGLENKYRAKLVEVIIDRIIALKSFLLAASSQGIENKKIIQSWIMNL